MIAILSLVISLIIFLFTFYYLAKDDFFFIRKGITMEHLFNVLFVGLFFGILSARFSYVILHLRSQNISPFRFVLPYFFGFSLSGGLIGLFLAYIWLTRRKKIARLRFLDYISISLLAAFPVFFIGVFSNFYLFIMYAVLFLFFIYTLVPKNNKGLLREGSITYIFLIMVSLVSFLQDIFLLYTKNILLSRESFLFLGLFSFSLYLLVRLETKKPAKS